MKKLLLVLISIVFFTAQAQLRFDLNFYVSMRLNNPSLDSHLIPYPRIIEDTLKKPRLNRGFPFKKK
jgi:hypothetical protein